MPTVTTSIEKPALISAILLAFFSACSQPGNSGGSSGGASGGVSGSASGNGSPGGVAPSGAGGDVTGGGGQSGTHGAPLGGAGIGGTVLGGSAGAIAGASNGGAGVAGGGAAGASGAASGMSGSAGQAVGGTAGAGAGGGAGAGAGGGPSLGTLGCGETWSSRAKGDTWIHDPSLTRDGNVYYLFSTPAPAVAPTPRALVPFKTSNDGVTWTNRGAVFSALLPWWSADIPMPETWAADVRKVNGTYYLYYSISAWFNFNSSIGLATNTTLDPANPAYEWIDRGKVIDFRNGGSGVNVIDPNLFVDDDGSFWLVYGSYRSGIRLVQLNPSTGKLLQDPPVVTVLTNGLGEGSSLIKHGSYYYLLVSRGTCCAGLDSTYQVVMGRSSTRNGPYLTRDNRRMLDGAYTVLLAGDAMRPGQGGQSFYEENGQLYMAYHAYTAPSGDSLINVRPVFFDQAGWITLDPCAVGR